MAEALAGARRRGGPRVVVCPTVREADGLARSSRNVLLPADARDDALALSRALVAARAEWERGVRDAEALTRAMTKELERPGVDVEYAAVRDPRAWTAEAQQGELERAVAVVAAVVGGVRLIDNSVLSAPEPALDRI